MEETDNIMPTAVYPNHSPTPEMSDDAKLKRSSGRRSGGGGPRAFYEEQRNAVPHLMMMPASDDEEDDEAFREYGPETDASAARDSVDRCDGIWKEGEKFEVMLRRDVERSAAEDDSSAVFCDRGGGDDAPREGASSSSAPPLLAARLNGNRTPHKSGSRDKGVLSRVMSSGDGVEEDEEEDAPLMMTMDLDDLEADIDLDALPSELVATNTRAKVFTSKTMAATDGRNETTKKKPKAIGSAVDGENAKAPPQQSLLPQQRRQQNSSQMSLQLPAQQLHKSSKQLPGRQLHKSSKQLLGQQLHESSSQLPGQQLHRSSSISSMSSQSSDFQRILHSVKKVKRHRNLDDTPHRTNERSHRMSLARIQDRMMRQPSFGASDSHKRADKGDRGTNHQRVMRDKENPSSAHRRGNDSGYSQNEKKADGGRSVPRRHRHRRHRSADYDPSDQDHEPAGVSHRRTVSFGMNTSIDIPRWNHHWRTPKKHRPKKSKQGNRPADRQRRHRHHQKRSADYDQSEEDALERHLQTNGSGSDARSGLGPGAEVHASSATPLDTGIPLSLLNTPSISTSKTSTAEKGRGRHRRVVSFDSPSPVQPCRLHRRCGSHSSLPTPVHSNVVPPTMQPLDLPRPDLHLDPALLPIFETCRPSRRTNNNPHKGGVSPRTAEFIARDSPAIIAMCQSMDEQKQQKKQQKPHLPGLAMEETHGESLVDTRGRILPPRCRAAPQDAVSPKKRESNNKTGREKSTTPSNESRKSADADRRPPPLHPVDVLSPVEEEGGSGANLRQVPLALSRSHGVVYAGTLPVPPSSSPASSSSTDGGRKRAPQARSPDDDDLDLLKTASTSSTAASSELSPKSPALTPVSSELNKAATLVWQGNDRDGGGGGGEPASRSSVSPLLTKSDSLTDGTCQCVIL